MFIPLHDANHLRHIRLQYVTLAIIAANCLIWLVVTASGINNEANWKAIFVSYGFIPAVANGYVSLPAGLEKLPELATYLSYAFLHGNFMHLAGNMLFIWVFGDNVEDATGHVRFLLFFLICAVAGAAFHAFVLPHSQSPLIGASGAAAGIITAYLMLHPHVKVWILALGRIPLRIPAMWVIGAWIIFQVANLVLTSGENVSWGAHVGGIIAGAILLPLFKRRDVQLFDNDSAAATGAPALPETAGEDVAGTHVADETLSGGMHIEDGHIEDGHIEDGQTGDGQSAADTPMPWGRPRR